MADVDALADGIEVAVARLVAISKKRSRYLGVADCRSSRTCSPIAELSLYQADELSP